MVKQSSVALCLSFSFLRKARYAAFALSSCWICLTSIEFTKVPIDEKELFQPPLQEIVDVLSNGLTSTFESVSVSVAETPDLTQAPYNLTSPGLTGNPTLVEIGGPAYMMRLMQRKKIYDLAMLAKYLNRDPVFFIGAGAGPWLHINVNCEAMVDLSIRNGIVKQGTRVVSIIPVGAAMGSSRYLQQQLPDSETRIAMLGNYLLSEGKPGKVIKVVVKKRIGQSNFITAIRETLTDYYGDKVVGLGGLFLLRSGRVRFHVMPDFSSTPFASDAEVDAWLHFFEMKAPIVNLGTIVTSDFDLDLRLQHFHGYSSHGDSGHYHYDTTPDTVEYEGYFNVASSVIRIDPPAVTND